MKVGDRLKAKFDDNVWYEGEVASLFRGRVGEIVKVKIDYDDGDVEECSWPDKNIVILGDDDGDSNDDDSDDTENENEKKKQKTTEADL